MPSITRLRIATLVFSLLGTLLSGYLTYWNYFGRVCHQNPISWIVSCGGPTRVLIFGQPTCVYGFAMFLAVTILTILGFHLSARMKIARALVMLGIAGALFSGGLAIYELWILKISFTGLPACVYGFVFYLGILVTSIIALRIIRRDVAQTPTTRLSQTN